MKMLIINNKEINYLKFNVVNKDFNIVQKVVMIYFDNFNAI